MRSFIRPRWRKPAWTVVAGTVFAAAWIIHGGRYWWLFVTLIAVATVARAFAFYMQAGEDDDLGALAGSRADERQKLISLRSRALACNFVAIAAFIGLTAAVALKAAWWWPFAVILAVTGFGYLLGLSTYGVAQAGTAGDDGADTGYQAPSPAGR
ncbi:MAG: hypothetical protein J2P30_07155 [Actinobacteria bacterium]|nr:hypothetical protein [Actinomycetota bacterium]